MALRLGRALVALLVFSGVSAPAPDASEAAPGSRSTSRSSAEPTPHPTSSPNTTAGNASAHGSASRAASPGVAFQMRGCRHNKLMEEPDFVCLDLVGVLAKNQVVCTAVQGGLGQPPRFPQDFAQRHVQLCDGDCRYFIHGLKPDRVYRTFCAVLDSEDEKRPVRIFPSCVGDSLAGIAIGCGLDLRTSPSTLDTGGGHSNFGVTSLFGALLLVVYMTWSFRFEHVHGVHETAVAVVVGLLLGFVIYYMYGRTPVFDYDTFSYFVLPMVIFDAGFNLEKTRFFWYSTQIVSLGIIGTVTIFVLLYVGSGASELFPTIFQTLQGDQVHLNVKQRLTLASVLSSTDTVAPIAFLPKETYPRLFAVVFGEGVLNDVVAILLSSSVNESPELPSIRHISWLIGYYLITSSVMGLSFGFVVSFVFKHSQWLHEEVVHPCALMLLLNYICYVLAEMCDFSSIFALFLSSLLCGHYAQSALSEDAQQFADQISEFMAYCAEAFVFGYFGLTAVGYIMEPSFFSPSLIVFYSLCIFVARGLTVFFLNVFLRCLRWHHLSIKWNHLAVISLAGCMRGTIAYALILKAMPPANQQSTEETVMVSTVLGIVLTNCLVFGALFPYAMRWLGVEPVGPDLPRGISFAFLKDSAEASHHYRMRARLHQAWSHFDNARLKPLLRKDWSHPQRDDHVHFLDLDPPTRSEGELERDRGDRTRARILSI